MIRITGGSRMIRNYRRISKRSSKILRNYRRISERSSKMIRK